MRGQCLECAAGFFLDLTTKNLDSQCDTCDITGSKAIIIDNLDGRVNICVDKAYMYPMIGYGINTVDNANTWKCTYIARVAFTQPYKTISYEEVAAT